MAVAELDSICSLTKKGAVPTMFHDDLTAILESSSAQDLDMIHEELQLSDRRSLIHSSNCASQTSNTQVSTAFYTLLLSTPAYYSVWGRLELT